MDSMSEKPRSPLTNNNHIELIDTLIIKELIEDWKNFLSIDISEENIAKYEKIDLFRCQETELLFYYPFDIAGSEKLYNSLSRFDWYYMTEKWEYDVALNSLRNYSRVLDVGCGYGAFIERLKQNNCTEAIGIEQNKNALEFTRIA
jgi:2-polyprenyl-3-methyl-5-hydroxy-6-metoxy-1,4-benzoquinol methylase